MKSKKVKLNLLTTGTNIVAEASSGFALRHDEGEYPKNFTAELREQLKVLGAPPACLRFSGCIRLVYRAAKQVGAVIKVNQQHDGTFRIWKRPSPGGQPAKPKENISRETCGPERQVKVNSW